MDLSQFGASAAVVAVVIIFLKYLQADGNKRDSTYHDVALALNRLTKATEKNTTATTSADKYLRERNGRDNEFQKENIAALIAIPSTMQEIANKQATDIITAVKVTEQHVEHLHVEHQDLKE